ncbi:hypothetical protein SAMN05421839_11172 [Halolactibacillus halophilus]|uniref:Uncharacterized protein n=1 Tax=Halolactibacillus halophilus TaxID=306540 RepID=A0A1I5NYJ9_9BACI|nr:hypothetical protein HHA03_10220 [Halolactibacillus halophilus]SFP26376.1 hypothetical protein SAMN05421839_11172 [Halolactibacillus halophilus]
MLKKSWFYVFFGLYPLSFFEMGRSEMRNIKQFFILTVVIFILIGVGYWFNFLNINKSILVILFVIAPYIMGKLNYLGIWSSH